MMMQASMRSMQAFQACIHWCFRMACMESTFLIAFAAFIKCNTRHVLPVLNITLDFGCEMLYKNPKGRLAS